ncbi:hypothetical protein BJX65DRAFT_297775 [Aspergillus insuetus]
MVDVGGIIGYTTTTGIEALKILNKWLDSKETAKAWYGNDAEDFLKRRHFGNKLFRKKYAALEIEHVFTIQKEDWRMLIDEALPVAHTWYRKRKDESGECSWLPLYWACRDQLGKQRVLQKADAALASIGLVSGLPAARLDLWGLIVLAYSNGARARVATAEGGGFNATLLCKHFILSIRQWSVNAPTIGSLEPREHPAETHEALTKDESFYLLEYGHSLSPRGVATAWGLDGANSEPPPTELSDSRSDSLLTRMVLDTFQASRLKEKFHHGIIEYWEEWAKFMATKDRNGGQDNSPIQALRSEPCRAEEASGDTCSGHVELDNNVVREMQILHQLQFELVMLSYEPEYHDVLLDKIKRIHELDIKMLWRLKLLFLYDSIILYVFKAYGELVKTLIDYHLLRRYIKNTRVQINTEQELNRLARMLNFCQQIHVKLSVRNTGSTVLLS